MEKSTDYLETARQHYKSMCDAELAIINGQEYVIGSRRLKRADLSAVRESIKYWRREIEKEEAALKGRRRGKVFRAVPRDV